MILVLLYFTLAGGGVSHKEVTSPFAWIVSFQIARSMAGSGTHEHNTLCTVRSLRGKKAIKQSINQPKGKGITIQ